MSSAAFWDRRVRRYGHTGWSDAAVYAYDQRLRAAALLELLQAGPSLRDAAVLDFGCGSGDFCALLAPHCARVVGCDLSPAVLAVAARRHAFANLRFDADVDAALAEPGGYALILAITVLQHVVDDIELRALLQRLAAALQPAGRLIVLDTFASPGAGAGAYLKRRPLAELVDACAAAGLGLQRRCGFYHPAESPTAGFSAYRRRPLVRALARAAGWRVPGAAVALQRNAARAAAQDRDFLGHDASPTQWLVLGKATA